MEYTINKLSKLASISSRTLRYYDEIGLLKPLKINSSGYRVYGENELKRLQQILFLRGSGEPPYHLAGEVPFPGRRPALFPPPRRW